MLSCLTLAMSISVYDHRKEGGGGEPCSRVSHILGQLTCAHGALGMELKIALKTPNPLAGFQNAGSSLSRNIYTAMFSPIL